MQRDYRRTPVLKFNGLEAKRIFITKKATSLLVIAIRWTTCFILMSHRILSAVDNESDRVVRVISLAGKALIPEIIPRDQLYELQSRSKLLSNDTNNSMQVKPPEHNQFDHFEGEMGSPVNIDVDKLSPEEKAKYDKGWKDHAYNEYASRLVSLHRRFPDFRDPECKAIKYKEDLPKTSVIIIFHNEAWSVLLRTVHSVLDQTPSKYLEEIILVDDASNIDYLQKPLDDYINKLEKVQLLRMQSRSGLILARIAGSDAAKGEVVVFLDSHCEVTIGWLEPLLDILVKNPNASAVPVIETIQDNTLSMYSVPIESIQVGGFTWDLIFNWHVIPEHERKRRAHRTDPIRSPTMAGGLFAIRKDWFEKLGKYDDGMRIWGGENIELSFKLWLCGGELLTSPCSHVGHIFRKRSPYQWPKGENVVLRNTMRVGLVWLDDYLPYFLDNIPVEKRKPEVYGNITGRHKLRESLNCKKFEYFHRNIYPELFIPKDMLKIGEVKNVMENLCLDSAGKRASDNVIVFPCHGLRGTQLWYYSPANEIRKAELCLDYAGGIREINKEGRVVLLSCHGRKGNQLWHIQDNKLIKHSSGLCLAISSEKKLVMSECDFTNSSQIWEWPDSRNSISS
ncbi:hypothetical protein GJ496_004118 [Pomphorhynchus laevis]|nr:hypothetical protein GJ496_004118 [Pomphorhynchus laevis]